MVDVLTDGSGIPGRWDSAVLAPIAEVNEQLLDTLRLAAAGPANGCQRLVTALRPEWYGLTPAAQQRLAACPYLLIDAGFAQPERWQQMQRIGVMEAPVAQGYFSTAEGVTLIRRTLLLAWHLARSNRLAARLMLGMSAQCAERVAATRLRDLDALAELCPAWILPRWENQPRIWQQLIASASRDNHAGLRSAQLRGLQLLAAGAGFRAPTGEGDTMLI